MARRDRKTPPDPRSPEATAYHLDPPIEGDEVVIDEGFDEWTAEQVRQAVEEAERAARRRREKRGS